MSATQHRWDAILALGEGVLLGRLVAGFSSQLRAHLGSLISAQRKAMHHH